MRKWNEVLGLLLSESGRWTCDEEMFRDDVSGRLQDEVGFVVCDFV